MNNAPPLLRPSEVARALGVTRQHVTRLIRDGRLAAVNIAYDDRPCWRVPTNAVTIFTASNHRSKMASKRITALVEAINEAAEAQRERYAELFDLVEGGPRQHEFRTDADSAHHAGSTTGYDADHRDMIRSNQLVGMAPKVTSVMVGGEYVVGEA